VRLLTTKAAAEALSFSPKKIRKMIGTGELMAYRIGGEFRIREEDLISVLDRCRIDPSPGAPEE
jgi:excisionase family DNA binding protein